MTRAFTLVASRRGKWITAIVWLLICVAAGSVAGKYQDAQRNDPSSYLPGSAESSKALAAVKHIQGGDEVTDVVVVFNRPTGLTGADFAAINSVRDTINSHLPPGAIGAGPPVASADATTALLDFGYRFRGDNNLLKSDVGYVRDVAHGSQVPGLQTKVTGPGGISYDAGQVYSSINGTLLAATVALVFILLVLIYRSPIFWAIPLVAVAAAEIASEGLGYVLTQLGVTINSQSSGILTVLVFGVGTDYALLLVARYREELHRHSDRHEAMRIALGRSRPVIFASGMTVICALLCLLVAEVNGTRGLGPIGAMGVALAMLSGLTLLPALLVIFGRGAFWPFVPRFESEDWIETRGIWHRIAQRVGRRPRPIGVATLAVLLVLCAGLFSANTNLTQGNSFRGQVESKQGQDLIAAHYPAGASAPAQVVVTDPSRLAAVRVAVAHTPGVAGLGPVQSGPGGAFFTAVLTPDPSTHQAFDLIGPVRQAAKAAGGPTTLVGGPTALERDLRASASRDDRLIVPLILAVVFIILALLLRALVAPVLLILTVIVSYAAALGTGSFLFTNVFGYPGEDPSLVLFTFLFLVALGVDYNIFLMARAREETMRVGTRAGVVRGLAVTGGVITSAGLVLCATFSALASLPLVSLTEIGFVIAFGVLLDTFLVRTVLVPALVIEVGSRVWWPSALARRRAPEPANSYTRPDT